MIDVLNLPARISGFLSLFSSFAFNSEFVRALELAGRRAFLLIRQSMLIDAPGEQVKFRQSWEDCSCSLSLKHDGWRSREGERRENDDQRSKRLQRSFSSSRVKAQAEWNCS
jgi:hypothetical protein